MFHQYNAPAHKSVIAMAAVRNCGSELVDHLLYSADLAPSEFSVPDHNMNKLLAGKQYRIDDEVISAVEDFFEDQDKSSYTTGI